MNFTEFRWRGQRRTLCSTSSCSPIERCKTRQCRCPRNKTRPCGARLRSSAWCCTWRCTWRACWAWLGGWGSALPRSRSTGWSSSADKRCRQLRSLSNLWWLCWSAGFYFLVHSYSIFALVIVWQGVWFHLIRCRFFPFHRIYLFRCVLASL